MKHAEIGRRVRARRMELGWTQEGLAERADISLSYVGHIERGEKIGSLDTMIRLCDCLGVSLDWLVYGRQEIRCDGTHCLMIGDLLKLIDSYALSSRSSL